MGKTIKPNITYSYAYYSLRVATNYKKMVNIFVSDGFL